MPQNQGKTKLLGGMSQDFSNLPGYDISGVPEKFDNKRFVFNFGPLLHSGSGKGVFWKRGLFRKVHFLEILEISRDSREPPDSGKERRI